MFDARPRFRGAIATGAALVLLGGWVAVRAQRGVPDVPRWGLFEAAFTSTTQPENPLQDVELNVTFVPPSGEPHTVRGFWDGGSTWRVRFSPDQTGTWRYTTAAVPESDAGLHARRGTFRLALPLALLLLTIPVPAILLNQVAFPLQLLASRAGEGALTLLRIPVLREGNVIVLSTATLEVAR